jgi:hypothetical protein
MQKPAKGTHRPQVRPAQQPTPQPQTRVSVVSQKFEGPIPPPDVLQRYDELMPGAASIIIEMAQKQAGHRQLLELEAQRADIAARDKQLDIEGAGSAASFSMSASAFSWGGPLQPVAPVPPRGQCGLTNPGR